MRLLMLLLAFGSTSDKQDLRSLSLTSQPKIDLGWSYKDEPKQITGWTADLYTAQMESVPLDYSRYQARAGYLQKHEGQWVVMAWVGAHQFKQSRLFDNEKTAAVGEVEVQQKLSGGNWLSVKAQSHYALDRISPIQGDLQNLHAFSLKPTIHYFLTPELKATYRGHYDWLEDKNNHMISDGQVLYPISRSEFWLWVGVGGEYTTNSERSPQYWSPPSAYSYGLRYDFAYAMGDWSLISGASLHALHEVKDGVGHYFTSGLQYGKREEWLARLTFESINSLQGANHWSSEAFMLYLNFAN